MKAAEQARRAAAGRLLLEAGRKSRAGKRGSRLSGEAQALAKVLALFEEGLLAEEEVELFYGQLKVAEAERQASEVRNTEQLRAKEKVASDNKGAAAALAGASGLAAAAAGIVGTVAMGEASLLTEAGVGLLALGGSGLGALAASREGWLGDAARSTGRFLGKAASDTAEAAVASTVASIEAAPSSLAKAATK